MPEKSIKEQIEAKELVPFKRKVLVTFYPEICIPMNGTAVFTRAAVCEFTDQDINYREEIPSKLIVVGLPDRPKFTQAVRLFVGIGHIQAAVYLDDDFLVPIQ